MLKGQCQKFSINRKCQKRLMFLQGDKFFFTNLSHSLTFWHLTYHMNCQLMSFSCTGLFVMVAEIEHIIMAIQKQYSKKIQIRSCPLDTGQIQFKALTTLPLKFKDFWNKIENLKWQIGRDIYPATLKKFVTLLFQQLTILDKKPDSHWPQLTVFGNF